MMKKYLGNVYDYIINKYNFEDICEIRLRVDCFVSINVMGIKRKLDIKFSEIQMQEFMLRITGNSIYRVNEQLKYGFITLEGGIRVGLAGEVVCDEKNIVTLKNIQSANIRIPHNIDNCSLDAFPYIFNGDIKNTLIMSKPAVGKTTFLRDLVRQIGKVCNDNILVADERSELSMVSNKSLGDNIDIYKNCTKDYAFRYGIRSMNPQIFVTDELNLETDAETLIACHNSGIKLISTIHCDGIESLKLKKNIDKILENKIFDRILLLSNQNKIGELAYIFDGNMRMIYCR